MDSKGKEIAEDISHVDSPVSWDTFFEPTVQFMEMDDYLGFEPDPLGIWPGDVKAWTPLGGNWDNWGNWVPPIPENGWNRIPQSPNISLNLFNYT